MLESAHQRDRYNRPRIALAVIDASSSIELELFEQVDATPGTALLRLAARPSDVDGVRASTLVVDDGRTQHRLTPIPQPADASGLLRAAYAAPLKMLVGRVAFALELPDGSVRDLPSPTRSRQSLNGAPGARGATGTVTADAAVDAERRRREEAERRAEARRVALIELERRLAGERDRRAEAEAAQQALRAQLSERNCTLGERDLELRTERERLLEASASIAEERVWAAAMLEQAQAAATQAARCAQEQERVRAALQVRAELEAASSALGAPDARALALAAEHEARLERGLTDARLQIEHSHARAVAAEAAAVEADRAATAVQKEHERAVAHAAQLRAEIERQTARAAGLQAVIDRHTVDAEERHTAHQADRERRLSESDTEPERLRAESEQALELARTRTGELDREIADARSLISDTQMRLVTSEAIAADANRTAASMYEEHRQALTAATEMAYQLEAARTEPGQ